MAKLLSKTVEVEVSVEVKKAEKPEHNCKVCRDTGKVPRYETYDLAARVPYGRGDESVTIPLDPCRVCHGIGKRLRAAAVLINSDSLVVHEGVARDALQRGYAPLIVNDHFLFASVSPHPALSEEEVYAIQATMIDNFRTVLIYRDYGTTQRMERLQAHAESNGVDAESVWLHEPLPDQEG